MLYWLGTIVGLPKLWKTVKSLNQGPTTPSNQSISFNGKPESDARKIAAKFNRQFTSIIKHSSSRTARILTRKIKSRSNTGLPNFTSGDTAKTVKQSFGLDNIFTLHLKHLGPAGIDYLTTMYNLSSSEIPSLWKMSKILPSLKAGKDPSDSKSYRPISVLCPAIKILERLLLPILDQHLPNSSIQHGFRRGHSTTSALLELNSAISSGFNQKRPPRRTLLLQIDLSQAFDLVNHEKLLADLNNSSLPSAIVKWFSCYLKGRQSRTLFHNCLSSCQNIHTAVTSPKLFNFYLYNLPPPLWCRHCHLRRRSVSLRRGS